MDLSPTTVRTYRAQIEQTLRPRLANVSLNRLSAKHLEDLYGAMKADGRSPKTIRNHHAIVSSALAPGRALELASEQRRRVGKPPG